MKRFTMGAAIALMLCLAVPNQADACQPIKTIVRGVVARSVNVVQSVRYSVRNVAAGIRNGVHQARCN